MKISTLKRANINRSDYVNTVELRNKLNLFLKGLDNEGDKMDVFYTINNLSDKGIIDQIAKEIDQLIDARLCELNIELNNIVDEPTSIC